MVGVMLLRLINPDPVYDKYVVLALPVTWPAELQTLRWELYSVPTKKNFSRKQIQSAENVGKKYSWYLRVANVSCLYSNRHTLQRWHATYRLFIGVLTPCKMPYLPVCGKRALQITTVTIPILNMQAWLEMIKIEVSWTLFKCSKESG